LSDVYINIENKEYETAEPKFKTFVESRLALYKGYDAERGFKEEYPITKMVQMAKRSFGRGCCGVLSTSCDHNLSIDPNSDDCMSFDRLRNDRGHGWRNLRIICKSCNVRSKHHEEKYG